MNSRIPPGSVALVTGSSSGFGLLSCVELARRGMHVFASMRDTSRSERLDEAMAAAGQSFHKLTLDVDDPGSIAAAIDEVTGAVGPVDVLVNNAGYALAGFVEEWTTDELRAQFETNFFGLVCVTKAVLGGMRERRRGRIINISSLSGKVANPGFAAYAASKFAVEGFSEGLRHEMLPYGVYVVLIEPGMFPTEIGGRNRRVAAATFAEDSPYREQAERLAQLVERRMTQTRADPDDVARLVGQVATADRPRLRYPIGTDAAVLGTLKNVVPFGLWEYAVGRLTGGDQG